MVGMLVDSSRGKYIQSTQEMILRFTSEVSVDSQTWAQQLIQSPANLEQIERTVHNAYARGADMLVVPICSLPR